LGLVVWTAGGAILGATRAGALTRAFRSSQARKKLRGTWSLIEVDGHEVPAGADGARRVIPEEGTVTERQGRRAAGSGLLLEEPTATSLTPKTGPDAGTPRRGICRLEGTTLTICLAYPGHPRPASFDARPDVQQVLVYRRGGKAGA